MSRAVFYFFYRLLGYPLLRLVFRIAGFFSRKIRLGLDSRRASPWASRIEKRESVWFHCASGEFEYAKPVIRALKTASHDTRIVVTYFSPTYEKAVRDFPGVDFACPLPWDSPRDLARFFEAQKPRALLIARTDAWPEMLRQAENHGIPSLLFAATLPKTAGRVRGPVRRWMTRAVFSHLDSIFCVDDQDLAQLSRLGFADKTRVAGDTRYDQVMERLKTPRPLREKLFLTHPRERVVVCGSTWEEDERILIEAAWTARDFLFVLVPHEPKESHLKALELKIRERGLSSVRYSQASSWESGDVLLVDQIGILAELYQKAGIAFVGGSFRKTVHSVMEPLAAGCHVLVGPLYQNNREAIEFEELGFVTSVSNASEFVSALKSSEAEGGEKIRREILHRTGKSQIVVDWILKRIPTS